MNRLRPTCGLAVWAGLFLFAGSAAFAEVAVKASVDRNRISLGESFQFTISVEGTQQNPSPVIPEIEGLSLTGPSLVSRMNMVNGQVSQSVNLVYQVTPVRIGKITIPSLEVRVGAQKFTTEPIVINVEKGPVAEDMKEKLFGAVKFDLKRMYVGQTAPLDVYLYLRQDLPLRGVSGFQFEAEGLNYHYRPDAKQATQTMNGQGYHVFLVEGAISPSQVGKLKFGPAVLKVRLAVRANRPRNSIFDDSMFEQMLGNGETREVPVVIDPVPIEVVELPSEGKPAQFDGAVGQWNLEVTANPTNVAVGDPITLTIKVNGHGNIDTIPSLKLGTLDQFKTYDPTTKTTKNDLGTEGERVFQQVLIPKNAEVNAIPGVTLAYFDPIAEKYKVARKDPISLSVKPGTAGNTTVVNGQRQVSAPDEKLGEDIVYLKGDLGSAAPTHPFCTTMTFCALNILPIALLVGGGLWKQRSDRLRGDVAYARRSRAAKNAHHRLGQARAYDDAQRALQQYLGDRLNIPSSGITTAIIDDRLAPRGLSPELALRLKTIFEVCDHARFAGDGADETRLRDTIVEAGRIIDELEQTNI